MYGAGSGWGAAVPVAAARPQSKYTVDERAALNVVSSLSGEDLDGLLTDEDKFNKLLYDLQQVKDLEVDRETLLAENKRLAEENLEKEPQLMASRAQLSEKYETAARLKEELTVNKSKLDSLCSKQSLDTTHAILQTQAVDEEDKSEEMCEQFVDGRIDIETFSNEFVDKRTSAHLLRIKAEKMGEIIIRSKNQARPEPQPIKTTPAVQSATAPGIVPPPIQPNNWGAQQQYTPYYPRPVAAAPMPNYYAPQNH